MLENELQEYTALNSIAEKGGIVLFGGKEDKTIPLCELKQAFSLPNIYNRSVEEFWIKNAIEYYDLAVAPLFPDYLLVHISESDVKLFEADKTAFDCALRDFIAHVRSKNKKCNIVLVSMKNFDGEDRLVKINTHLKYIANSERCEFGDISTRKVWNPKATKDVVRFVSCMGIAKRPIYDLIKILYHFDSAYTA